uniref:AlNc14C171G8002 protein n=1 Tax=Albugo laibachii Nc14 TaxID=890382 RepID=F0WEI7_9STRA|nr:AlNc14C75G5038 [Albugo laibachii Nc14]CCA22869.1 AlNc14C171G8002 [Albugo laibachii Nc14]|eukprot:CCA22869.1 AlNc14C171G8002 [Albugo laibachii Nc14]
MTSVIVVLKTGVNARLAEEELEAPSVWPQWKQKLHHGYTNGSALVEAINQPAEKAALYRVNEAPNPTIARQSEAASLSAHDVSVGGIVLTALVLLSRKR